MMRPTVAKEVAEEIAFHIEMTARELIASGLSPEQARLEASRRFGQVDAVEAECQQLGRSRDRRARRAEFHLEVLQDLRIGVRQLARSKMFTAIAVLTLALGIGATTTVFSALYAVVLNPLPYDNSDRVVTVEVKEKDERLPPTAAEFVALRDNVSAFERVAAHVSSVGFTITDGDLPVLVGGGRVSGHYFDVFAVKPQLGRVFTVEDDTPGRNKVVVLSYRAWVSRYNKDPNVVGRTTHMNGETYTVVGVMPKSFDITSDGDEHWVPLGLTPSELAEEASRFLRVVARLAPATSLAQANSAATAVERTTVARFSERRAPASEASVVTTRFVDDLVGDFSSLMFILMGAVGFVLLIACTNVANLLLARGAARAKELAIRAALGAGRARLIRQLLTESVLLAFIGAALGVCVAIGLLGVLLRVSPADIPRLDQARVNGTVMAFTLAVAVLSSLIFGLVPALRAAGPQLQGTLREGGRESSVSGRGPLRQLLVASEVAMAMTLLTGAGLLIRSALLLQNVNPGFEPRGVMTARIVLPKARYDSGSSIVRAYDAMRQEAAQLPGVSSAALVSVLPLSGGQTKAAISTEAQPQPGKPRLRANLRLASANYFRTMRIPLRAGRDISENDNASTPAVIVLNEQVASTLFPAVALREIIGQRVNAIAPSASEPAWKTVIGIVGNVKDGALASDIEPDFYIPMAQTPNFLWPFIQRSMVLLVRGANEKTPATSFTASLARIVKQVDANLPLADARSMSSFLASSWATARFNTLLLATLGGVALALAMVGVYGVVAWFVSQRTHEIGLRMALGATPTSIWRLVAYRALTPIVCGMVAGVVTSLVTSRLLKDQLFNITPHDPLTLVSVVATLVAVSVLALYVPARRAMRVSPVEALGGA